MITGQRVAIIDLVDQGPGNQKKSLEHIVNFLNLNEKIIEELLQSHILLGFNAF